MKKFNLIISTTLLMGIVLYFNSCNSKVATDTSSIASDSLTIAKGQTSFTQSCSGCHNFKQDGIGPQLGGITTVVSVDWIKNFIKDPKSIIESTDERGQNLSEKYNTVMPSFAHLPEEDINAMIAFMNTQPAPDTTEQKEDLSALKNPVPEPIPLSDMVIELELVTQIPYSSEEVTRTRIAKLDYQPGTNKLFIMDLRGKLYCLQNNKPIVYMDMATLKPKFIDKPGRATGFGSFAFHPEFAKNGILYTTHTESPGSAKADFGYPDSIKVTVQWILSEWKTEQPTALSFSGKSRELMRVDMVTGIHGMQEITFNPLAKTGDEDYGLLYIGVGDGGSAEEGYTFLTRNKEMIWGSIIRIDPRGSNSANRQYGIPAENPFVNDNNPKVHGELYANGFRNPHRISWSKSGDILTSNIGQHNIEALCIIKAGHDYGWPIREGTFVINPLGKMSRIYPLPEDDKNYNITYPVAQYDHDEGKAITGGYEYWGSDIPQLQGKYLFGDLNNGRLFYVEMKDMKVGSQAPIKEWRVSFNGTIKTLAELCGDDWVHLRFGRDHQGELYIFTKPDGKVYRLSKHLTQPL